IDAFDETYGISGCNIKRNANDNPLNPCFSTQGGQIYAATIYEIVKTKYVDLTKLAKSKGISQQNKMGNTSATAGSGGRGGYTAILGTQSTGVINLKFKKNDGNTIKIQGKSYGGGTAVNYQDQIIKPKDGGMGGVIITW
ncbi:MAG: hypothetical protein K6A44_00015, partial [bacterium]|nr:hypothetical protein [bacterium]